MESSPPASQLSLDPTPDSSATDLDRPIKSEVVFDSAPALPTGIYQFGRFDEPIEGDELIKLRTFLIEKLTLRQLRKLIDTVEGTPVVTEPPLIKLTKIVPKPPSQPRKLKRRIKAAISDPVPGKRSFLLPADMRFSFCLLCINNFTIETPSAASKEINCVKICTGTRRILYDTNFMLADDWCSSVISVHFDSIECISVFKEQLVIYLLRPAIVEASYKNGCPSLLGTPNNEIENSMHHTIMMRSPHELAGIKTAILSADPNMVHKFTASKMDRHMGQVKGTVHPKQECTGNSDDYVPQQGLYHLIPNPSGTIDYMVHQVAPTSYGPVNGNLVFGQQPMYPGQGSDRQHYAGGPFNPGPHQMFKGNPYYDPQPPQEMPPANASDYCMQSIQPNEMHYVDPGFMQMGGGCVLPEDPVQDIKISVSPSKKGIIEMAMLGVDEMGACSGEERTATAAAHQHWGAGASHLGYFDTPMP